MLGNLAKFWAGAGGAIVTSLEAVCAPSVHWLPVASTIVTAVLVYLVPNSASPKGPAA